MLNIKDKNGNIITEENEIMEVWEEFLKKYHVTK